MTLWHALDVLKRVQDIKDNERRTAPRRACNATSCGNGIVLDLSSTGMRLLTSSKPPRGEHPVGLELCREDGSIRVGARAVWSRKTARGVYEIGFAFDDAA